MLTCHSSIQSSFPLHLTDLPQATCILKGAGGGRERREQRKTTKATSLGWGFEGGEEKTDLILPRLLKSIITFEIKLPSVQRITCAMLGCYFGFGLSHSQ